MALQQQPQPLQQPQRTYRRRGGFVWPLVLISLGAIFLLNNFNVLSWDVWDLIWRLWPVLLIAIGLDILFGRRSVLGSILAFVLIALVIGGSILYAVIQTPLIAGQPVTTDRIVQELAGATSANVRLNFGVGSLQVGALKDSGNLIEGTVVTGVGETVLRDFHMDGSTAQFSLRSQGVSTGPWPWRRRGFDRTWTLDLASSIPMSLRVDTGVGESVLDLSDLQVTDLDVNSGVGQTRLQLPAHGRMSGKVSGGIGQVVITVPDGMAARIHASAGLGGVSASSRFRHDGRYYTAGNYDTADDRIDLEINGGIGEIVIR
jgi:hypothetical protein